MRITELNIPQSEQTGLGPIEMGRLGDIVILAGRNGAGKTRLLKIIHDFGEVLDVRLQRLTQMSESFRISYLSEKYKNLDRYEWLWKVSDRSTEEFSDIRVWAGNIEKSLINIASNVSLDSYSDIPRMKNFVPKTLGLRDPSDLSKSDLLRSEEVAKTSDISTLNQSALPYIQQLQDKWYNITHQNYLGERLEKEKHIREYDQLCEMIKKFLGAKLSRNDNGEAALFGFPVGKAKMSEGQEILLQFCVEFHSQAENLSGLIVLMDEPENHLHPQAILDVINKLQEVLSRGQIWIATHSIPLLGNFDPSCIWWMDNGTVRHAGSQPEMVLQGLIGDEDRIEKLHDFLGLPAILAANRFAYQCLFKPAVSNTGKGDRQTRQIQDILSSVFCNKTLRILDFGAGRGRLIEAILEESPPEIREKIDYYAFDTCDMYRYECEQNIERMYGDSKKKRYFCDEKSLFSELDKNSVNIIVMCNVLHEIDPTEWLSIFGKDGIFRRLLKNDGFFLLVEDTLMPIGENAHSYGFLVLDTPVLKTLFSIKEDEKNFAIDDADGDDRLKAHCIPSSCIKNISQESFSSAIQDLYHFAVDEIKKIRANTSTPRSYRTGRKHAYHVQQLANASLVLKTLGK